MNKPAFQLAGTVITAALTASGCVSTGEFEKVQADKGQLEQQTRELQSQRRALEEEKTALERQQGKLRAELEALARQKAQLETSNQQTKAQYGGLVRNLTEEVKKGQLQVRQFKDMLTVEVAEQLFFDSGRATLKEQGKAVLSKVGEALKGYEDKVIRVVGHTDNVPISTAQFPSNWELSAARATTVVRFLQSAGVAPERLTASRRGDFSPLAKRLRIMSARLKIFSRRSSRGAFGTASALFSTIGSIFSAASLRTSLRTARDSSTRYSLAPTRRKFHPSLSNVCCLSIFESTEASGTIRSPSHEMTAFVPASPWIKKSTSNSPMRYFGSTR